MPARRPRPPEKGVGPSKYEFEGPTVDRELVTSHDHPGLSTGHTRRHPAPFLGVTPTNPDRLRFRSRLPCGSV